MAQRRLREEEIRERKQKEEEALQEALEEERIRQVRSASGKFDGKRR